MTVARGRAPEEWQRRHKRGELEPGSSFEGEQRERRRQDGAGSVLHGPQAHVDRAWKSSARARVFGRAGAQCGRMIDAITTERRNPRVRDGGRARDLALVVLSRWRIEAGYVVAAVALACTRPTHAAI